MLLLPLSLLVWLTQAASTPLTSIAKATMTVVPAENARLMDLSDFVMSQTVSSAKKTTTVAASAVLKVQQVFGVSRRDPNDRQLLLRAAPPWGFTRWWLVQL